VKLEIVDHIASIVEQQLGEVSTLSFNEILASITKDFDKKALDKIIKNSEASIAIKNRKIQWAFFKSFFSFPKLLITIAYSLFAFFIINELSNKGAYIIGIIIFLPVFLLSTFYSYSFFNKENYYIQKSFIYEKKKYTQIQKLLIFNRKNNILYLLNMALAISNLSVSSTALNYIHPRWLASSIVFTLGGFTWISFCAFLHQKKNLFEYSIKNYPEAFQLTEN
jgi:hypothetical protein